MHAMPRAQLRISVILLNFDVYRFQIEICSVEQLSVPPPSRAGTF